MPHSATKRFIAIGISVLAASIAITSSSLRAEESAADVVDRYRAMLSSVENVIFTSTWAERTSKTDNKEVITTDEEWKVDVLNRRLWCMTTTSWSLGTSGDSANRDKFTKRRSVYERILSAQRMYEISVVEKSRSAERFTSYSTIPDNYWESKPGWGYLSFPFGYVKHGDLYAYIPTLLDNRTTVRNDGEGVVLDRSGDDYTLAVRLVADKGWIASSVMLASGEESSRQFFSYQVERFEKIDGSWFPVSYKCECHVPSRTKILPKEIRMVDGALVFIGTDDGTPPISISAPAQIINTEVELHDVKLGELSEEPFEFQAAVPQGLPVSMQDARHLDYVWLDGDVVPDADAVPTLLGDEQFIKGTGARPWLIYGNIAVALVLGGVYLIRRWFRRSHSA